MLQVCDILEVRILPIRTDLPSHSVDYDRFNGNYYTEECYYCGHFLPKAARHQPLICGNQALFFGNRAGKVGFPNGIST